MRFQKGQSGNPGGRSKKRRQIEEIVQAAVEGGERGNRAVQTLMEIMLNPGSDCSQRVRSAELLLAYGYGKPLQRREHTGPNGSPLQLVNVVELTDDELVARIAAEPMTANGRGN